ncbi:hypothetical protein GN244_ATG10784 [Phytophthora infestans]|uniref:Uncharacterized protein n=1 Tax=Phytophthora infestans TaxID=4787 RepID=A0A833WCH5_PHYIN|nr:hypothetical protein GN244_ATG10784 [Phytophthora infestans]
MAGWTGRVDLLRAVNDKRMCGTERTDRLATTVPGLCSSPPPTRWERPLHRDKPRGQRSPLSLVLRSQHGQHAKVESDGLA